MIKVSFKEPQAIHKNEEKTMCLFTFCIEISIKRSVHLIFSKGKSFEDQDGWFVPLENIKSIEHVKPTDL